MMSLKKFLTLNNFNKGKISLKEHVFPYYYPDSLLHKTISVRKFFLEKDQSDIRFPLAVKPENDKGNIWGTAYNWAAPKGSNPATFAASRGGGSRLHAARDLYTEPYKKIYAITKGKVLSISYFYMQTWEVTVLHERINGEKFIVRYAELDSKSITVEKGQQLRKNQLIGTTGKLLYEDNSPFIVYNGIIVFMLHFELFTGAEGSDVTQKPLTDSFNNPFKRRSDLKDPIDLLKEGYNAQFS